METTSSRCPSRLMGMPQIDGDDDIWVMNADGSQQQNLTQNDAWDDQPQWSPDGGKIAFTSDRDGTPAIYIMRTDGSGARKLVQDPGLNMAFPTWSPDSSRIAFHAAVAEN
jgi:Tol biopolymer transport system component